ncbi:hypothetical protein H4582DRAFT_11187 [Lactarius indigo]|nr:hypothetical protein H4582DRAFT_11187 [Lactarius indigo]
MNSIPLAFVPSAITWPGICPSVWMCDFVSPSYLTLCTTVRQQSLQVRSAFFASVSRIHHGITTISPRHSRLSLGPHLYLVPQAMQACADLPYRSNLWCGLRRHSSSLTSSLRVKPNHTRVVSLLALAPSLNAPLRHSSGKLFRVFGGCVIRNRSLSGS